MEQVKFSVILPVHNGGDYVKACIKSILNQTYTRFNLIVLDNCSTDGTLEWIRDLKIDGIVIHPSHKLLPIEANWARIVGVEKNEFIVFTGHDDLFEPDYLETIFRLINKYPHASIYTTYFNFIDAQGKTIRCCKQISEKQVGFEFLVSLLTHQTDLVGTGFVMRSKDYDDIGGIPTSYPNLLFADLTIYHQLSCITYKAVATKNCFSFRLHQSTTFTTEDSKFREAFKLVIKYFITLQNINEQFSNVVSSYGNEFILYYCKSLSHRMIKSKKSKSGSVKQFVNECKGYSMQLSTNSELHPEKILSIRLALLIDRNPVFRRLYRLLRKMYSKPIFKN